MVKVNRETIYERFRRYSFPKQRDFWDWIDSFFHKDDKIPLNSVDGLAEQLNDKYTRSEGVELKDCIGNLEQNVELFEERLNSTDTNLASLEEDMETGDAATLRNAKEYTDTREAAISTAVEIKDEATLRAAKEYAETIVAALIDNSPETLDTLVELAAALGDDPNFATTVMNLIGSKVDKEAGKGLSANDFTDAMRKKLATLAAVAISGSYGDLEGAPAALPNPGALTFRGAVTGSYDGSKPLEVAIPLGSSGVQVSESEPTDPEIKVWLNPNSKAPEFAAKEDLNNKQDILKSGENIKTINGESILGEGNIETGGGGGSQGPKGDPGEDGKSAYQIAVENGFVGTEQQWLANLKGDTGSSGIALSETPPEDPNVKIWLKLPLGS